MRVLQMYRISESGKPGYLGVLDTMSADGRHNAVRYYGNKYGDGFPEGKVTNDLKVKTIRSVNEFSKYMKLFNPRKLVNPVQVGNVVFDLPFIHFGDCGIVQWMPHFEDAVNNNSFSLISGGSIIEYIRQQPIFISALHMRRHVAAYNSERLLINTSNFFTTRELNSVDGNLYCEGTYHVENGVWVCDKLDKTPIAGWKSR